MFIRGNRDGTRRRAGLQTIAGTLLFGPSVLLAKAAARRPRIGILCPTWDDLSYFVDALRAIGYDERRNVDLLYARADDGAELATAAARLVDSKVDVIVASPLDQVLAAKRATSTIPIVMLYGAAPVELGLIDSLARPGGNVTGTAAVPLELPAKQVDILRRLIPHLRRLALLFDTGPWGRLAGGEAMRAAQAAGITPIAHDARADADLKAKFAAIMADHPDALIVGAGFAPVLDAVSGLAALHRVPAMYAVAPAVLRHGGLISYSPNLPVLVQRTAAIVRRVLQGTGPRDIPVEQPTNYVLAINLATARDLGLTIPRSVMLSADVVVEKNSK